MIILTGWPLPDGLRKTLKTAGINAVTKEVSYEDYDKLIKAGDFDCYFGEIELPPDLNFTPLIYTGGSLNFGNYSNAGLDEKMKAFVAATQQERPAAFQEFSLLFNQEMPIIPICFEKTTVLMRAGNKYQVLSTTQDMLYKVTAVQ